MNVHPGGKSLIEAFCGQNATESFMMAPNHNIDHLDKNGADFLMGSTTCEIAEPVLPPSPPVAAPVSTPIADLSLPCLSLSDVQLHNAEGDCWQLIYDRVYDLTSYGTFICCQKFISAFFTSRSFLTAYFSLT